MAERPRGGHAVLVGLPGAGKSAVGRAVAARLGRPFLDFDAEIERRAGMTIAELFARQGEAHFRERERALTVELRDRDAMVLAPGGGWVVLPDVVGILRPPARLVWLEVSPATAIARMGASVAARPLLHGADPLGALVALLERRRAAYEGADHVVNAELLDFQGVVRQVAELVSAWTPGYVTR